MGTKHMKSCPTSLFSKEIKLKPKMKYTTHLPEWPNEKRWKISNDGRNVVQLEFS